MSERKRLSARERERCFDTAGGMCHLCDRTIQRGEAWDVSHPLPLAAGGEDVPENRRPAHRKCHREWTAKVDAPLIAKTRRQRQKDKGIRPQSSRPMPGSRASGWKHRLGKSGKEAWERRSP